MTFAAPAASPRSGGTAAPVSDAAGGRVVPPTGFDFALRPASRDAARAPEDEPFDRIVDHICRHAGDPDARRQAAGAMRRTIETALWQSAGRPESLLPRIHGALFGRALAAFAADRMKWLATRPGEWLVLLGSPKRLLRGIQAAWRGEDVAQAVREHACWHRVSEIAVFERDAPAPIVRVGDEVRADEDDWLVSNPIFCVTRRCLDGECASEETESDEEPVDRAQSMVVFGRRARIVARIIGAAPSDYRAQLQTLCEAADDILDDGEAGRAEQVFRLKQLVAPALTRKESVVARRLWSPAVVLAGLLIAGVLLLGSAGVEHLRWEGIVNQIDAEAGIEVIGHSLTWGHRQLDVLRDPRATPLAELLPRYGCDPASVIVRERPFVSADESMTRGVAARAFAPDPPAEKTIEAASAAVRDEVLADVRLDLVRSAFELPEEVGLSFAKGELTARGSLAEPAWSRLANAPKRFTWMDSVNLGGLRDLTAENIARLQMSVEKFTVEFAAGTTVLPEASKLRLQSIASEFSMLGHEARLKQQVARLQYCVTHPSLDAAAVEARVTALRHELERGGLPAGRVAPAAGHLGAPNANAAAFRVVLEPLTDAP